MKRSPKPLVALVALLPLGLSSADNLFDPYQVNGGLVSAVAGRDYVVIASDTRLMEGYEILSRNHVASRLWSPVIITASLQEDGDGDGDGGLTSDDGSIRLPNIDNDSDPTTSRPSTHRTYCCKQTPVWIASAGCNADCEELKRQVRSDLRAARYFETATTTTTAAATTMMPFSVSSHSVATLLSQVLYQRRGFPYYSFCVVAGGDAKVFVYDAIGSYEQVAVATSGTGRELLQPILDRKFSSTSTSTSSLAATDTFEESSAVEAESSTSSSSSLSLRLQQRQRRHVTQVSCSRQEAVEILRGAYEAVSEREIGVGDQLVMVAVQQLPDGGYECQVLTFPLKKH